MGDCYKTPTYNKNSNDDNEDKVIKAPNSSMRNISNMKLKNKIPDKYYGEEENPWLFPYYTNSVAERDNSWGNEYLEKRHSVDLLSEDKTGDEYGQKCLYMGANSVVLLGDDGVKTSKGNIAHRRFMYDYPNTEFEGLSKEEFFELCDDMFAGNLVSIDEDTGKLNEDIAGKHYQDMKIKNNRGIFNLKRLYYNHLKYLSKKYGTLVTDLEPLELVDRFGTKPIVKDFRFLQDANIITQFEGVFDFKNNKEDKEYIALYDYYNTAFKMFYFWFFMDYPGISAALGSDNDNPFIIRDFLENNPSATPESIQKGKNVAYKGDMDLFKKDAENVLGPALPYIKINNNTPAKKSCKGSSAQKGNSLIKNMKNQNKGVDRNINPWWTLNVNIDELNGNGGNNSNGKKGFIDYFKKKLNVNEMPKEKHLSKKKDIITQRNNKEITKKEKTALMKKARIEDKLSYKNGVKIKENANFAKKFLGTKDEVLGNIIYKAPGENAIKTRTGSDRFIQSILHDNVFKSMSDDRKYSLLYKLFSGTGALKNTQDPEKFNNHDAMMQLKQKYYIHLKNMESKYGKMLTQMHPLDVVDCYGGEFTKDFTWVQDIGTMGFLSGAIYESTRFKYNRKQEDFDNLANYYSDVYVAFSTYVAMGIQDDNGIRRELRKSDVDFKGTYSGDSREIILGAYEQAKLREGQIHGPSFNKEEQGWYRASMKKRSKRNPKGIISKVN